MRSCIYCGRTLEKNEKCNCPQSVRAREEKNKKKSKTTENTWNNAGNVYTTGYTGSEKKKKFKAFWKRSKEKINTNRMKASLKGFLADPVGGVLNPPYLNALQLILIVLTFGIVFALCGFFGYRGLTQSFFAIMPQTATIPVYRFGIADALLSAVLNGILIGGLTFAGIAVFWCIDRFALKRRSSFLDFSARLAAATVPASILGIVAVVIGFFSVFALLMLCFVGIIMWIVLTYEALKCEWRMLSTSKVFYLMSAGALVIFVLIFNILR